MKERTQTFFAFCLICCMIISGCGSANPTQDSTQTTEQATDTADETQSNTADNPEEVNVPGNTASDLTSDIDIPSPYENQAETSPESSDEIISGEKHTAVGIITDATKHSIAFQTPEGNSFYLTIPDTGVTGNLNYLTIGQMATLTYVGSLDESHASLVGISDSSMITGVYLEEYAFAIKIKNAVKAMDMKALSDLTNFPVFIDTGNYSGPINTSGEFEVIDTEKIFTEALLERIVNYNLFDLQYTDAGFVMGKGGPNITFDVDDDGILGIIGINCTDISR